MNPTHVKLKEALIGYIPIWLLAVLRTNFSPDHRRLAVDTKELESIAKTLEWDTRNIPERHLSVLSVFSSEASVFRVVTQRMIFFMTTTPQERRRMIVAATQMVFELPTEVPDPMHELLSLP